MNKYTRDIATSRNIDEDLLDSDEDIIPRHQGITVIAHIPIEPNKFKLKTICDFMLFLRRDKETVKDGEKSIVERIYSDDRYTTDDLMRYLSGIYKRMSEEKQPIEMK